MVKRLSLKEKGFVQDYIKMKNGTKAILNNYDVKTEKTAGVMAVESLGKPRIVQAIDKALQGAGLTDEHVSKIHHSNLTQDQDLRVSQTAIKDYYAVTGKLDRDANTSSVNVAFIIQTGK